MSPTTLRIRAILDQQGHAMTSAEIMDAAHCCWASVQRAGLERHPTRPPRYGLPGQPVPQQAARGTIFSRAVAVLNRQGHAMTSADLIARVHCSDGAFYNVVSEHPDTFMSFNTGRVRYYALVGQSLPPRERIPVPRSYESRMQVSKRLARYVEGGMNNRHSPAGLPGLLQLAERAGYRLVLEPVNSLDGSSGCR